RQAAGVRGRGEEAVVVELVRGGEGEAGAVGVAVHVVGVDPGAPLLDGEVEAVFHDVADGGGADVEPALPGPAVSAAQRRGRELVGVGAPVLVAAGAEVADHLAPLRLQAGDLGGAHVEEVEVVHRHLVAGVERAGELDLPARARGGRPDPAAPVRGPGVGGRSRI